MLVVFALVHHDSTKIVYFKFYRNSFSTHFVVFVFENCIILCTALISTHCLFKKISLCNFWHFFYPCLFTVPTATLLVSLKCGHFLGSKNALVHQINTVTHICVLFTLRFVFNNFSCCLLLVFLYFKFSATCTQIKFINFFVLKKFVAFYFWRNALLLATCAPPRQHLRQR